MTDKQKQAIRVLNNIRAVSKALSENDYFLLLEFVVGEPSVTYIPNNTWNIPKMDEPMTVMYGCSAETLTDNANKRGLSYGEQLIMENKSPI